MVILTLVMSFAPTIKICSVNSYQSQSKKILTTTPKTVNEKINTNLLQNRYLAFRHTSVIFFVIATLLMLTEANQL